MVDMGLVVAVVVVALGWAFAATMWAMRYVHRAREVEQRGQDIEDALREHRGDLDLVLVVRPAWRVFARLKDGSPIEACVQDEDVPLEKLVDRAAGGLQRATLTPPRKSGRFYLPQFSDDDGPPKSLRTQERERLAAIAEFRRSLGVPSGASEQEQLLQGGTWTVNSP